MKGKTFLTLMLMSTSVVAAFLVYDLFKANYFGAGVCGFLLVFYCPLHIWSALGRIKSEKRQAEHEKDMAKLRQATETFIRGLKDHDESR